MLYKHTLQLQGKLVGVGKIWSLKLAFSIERQENEIKLDMQVYREKCKDTKYEEKCKRPVISSTTLIETEKAEILKEIQKCKIDWVWGVMGTSPMTCLHLIGYFLNPKYRLFIKYF